MSYMSYLAVFLLLYSLEPDSSLILLVLLLPIGIAGAPRLPDASIRLIGIILLILSADPPKLSYGIDEELVDGCIVRALQDSVQRDGRSSGYRARLIASSAEDSLHKADGIVYVIADQDDVMEGDVLYLAGSASGVILRSYSSSLISTSLLRPIRRFFREMIISRLRCGEAGELALRLILGTGEMGGYSLFDQARISGLSHVLALSGMHLSIIAMMLSKILVFLNRKHSDAIISIFLFFFTMLSGWRPSLLRAFLFRLLLRFSGDTEDSFLMSALILFAFQEEALADLGAQYSLLSLGGIFLLSERICRGIRALLPLPYAISSSAASSLAALVFSAPLTMRIFGVYTAASVLYTLPASAIITLYMIVSIICLFLPLFPLLEAMHLLAEAFFSFAARFPQAEGPEPYIAMVSVSLLLCLIAWAEARHTHLY